MFANFNTKKIEMTKTEAREAGKLNTGAFKELAALRAAYPTFDVEIKKTKSKTTIRVTYAQMEKYIEAHDDKDNSVMKKFNMLRGKSDDKNDEKKDFVAAASYGEVKMWFLTQYPEIEKLSEGIDEIIKSAKAKRTKKKAA